jgi:tRNA A-37 threonylcarbamoyl transferase component Bud32
MADRRALASGDVLAGRYELHDLVSEKLGTSTWRAHDQVLHRNVGIELIRSSDPRADRFLAAARESTVVTDPRFLRVLDLIEFDHDHHMVVREWARAFPLSQVLAHSSLPNRRAATVVAEVAEAIAHAHELGVYHRRLAPHQVLLKQSGAVRIVGLGVSTALSPIGHQDTVADLHHYEQLDVQGLGNLLYACLTSRWPDHELDGLSRAPTEHGRLLRPRQVRAGVARDVDTITDRILGRPPRNGERPLRSAAEIARTLRLSGEDEDIHDDQPSLMGISSPDLLRLDPVIVPSGPPPGLEPPRRRPKAFEPAPPTTSEKLVATAKQATRGDRRFIAIGLAGALVILAAIGVLVGRSDHHDEAPATQSSPGRVLPLAGVTDFDPQGADLQENPGDVDRVIDGKSTTGWRTATYFGSERLGGLKDGVGVVVDLGGVRTVESVRVELVGSPTSFNIMTSDVRGAKVPTTLDSFRTVSSVQGAGTDVTVYLPAQTRSRYLLLWLTSLPRVDDDGYRAEIREVTVRGRS